MEYLTLITCKLHLIIFLPSLREDSAMDFEPRKISTCMFELVSRNPGQILVSGFILAPLMFVKRKKNAKPGNVEF